MIREEAIKVVLQHSEHWKRLLTENICSKEEGLQTVEALDMAIKVLKQEPCGDVISREEVLAETYNWSKDEFLRVTNPFDYLRKRINALPSVTPVEKTGQWEWVQYDSNPNIGNWHCSECRTIIPHMPENTDNTPIYKWCPMCRTKMVESIEKR